MKPLITFIITILSFATITAQPTSKCCAKAIASAEAFEHPSARQLARVQTVKIGNPSVEMQGDSLVVAFDAEIPARNLSSAEAYVITPTVVTTSAETVLPALSVEGRNYNLVNREQNASYAAKVRYDGKAQTIHYRKAIPVTADMKHAGLSVTTVRRSLCPCSKDNNGATATFSGDNAPDLSAFAGKTQIVYYIPADYQVEEAYVNDFGGKSIFRINGVMVDHTVFDPAMKQAITEYTRLKDQSGITIKGILVRVASSPEGSYAHNKTLAETRAANIRKYLDSGFLDMNESIVEVVPEAENWDGFLKNLAASKLADKATVERIVRETGDPDQREAELRKLPQWPAINELMQQTRNCRIEVVYTQTMHHDHSCTIDQQGLIESRLNAPAAYITGEEAARIASIDSTPAHLNNLMVARIENGAYDKALECAAQIPDKDTCPAIANNKAVLYDLTGNPSEAKTYFERSTLPAAAYNRGIMELNAGNETEAGRLLLPYIE